MAPVEEYGAFEDLEPELEAARKHCTEVLEKHGAECAEKMTDNCTWNYEWFPEPMPLEGEAGDDLEREVRHWITSATGMQGAPPDGPPIEPAEEEHVLVFADQVGFCYNVLDRVPECRIGSKKFVMKSASNLLDADIESNIASRTWDMIVVGFTLDAPASSATADVLAQQTAAVKAVFKILHTIFLKEGCCKRLAVFTNDIFCEQSEIHASRGLEITTNSTMFGMMNTARLELEIPVHLIDVEDVHCYDVYPYVAAELFRQSTFGVNTVRHCFPFPLKDGKRKTPNGRYVVRQMHSEVYQEAAAEFEIPEDGVIVISGGNGALGIVMGNWIMEWVEKKQRRSNYKPRFSIQFLSRSARVAEINEGNWQKCQETGRRLGIDVVQGKIDMGSQKSVDDFLRGLDGKMIGFIHSAGVLKDSMIPNQTWQKFEDVYASKHWPAMYLHDALERIDNPDLKFFWMFSSTSVQGNMGQINYGSSNSCMDGLARHRRALGKPALAIQWGAWGEVGMAATMDEASRRRVMMGPMPYFTVRQGLEGLEGGLRTGLPGFSVFIVNPPMYYGMIHGDPSHAARYGRNFSSEWCPTPPPASWSREQAYNIYRMYRYVMAPYAGSGELSWDQYIKPALQAAGEGEDDGKEMLGYGLA